MKRIKFVFMALFIGVVFTGFVYGQSAAPDFNRPFSVVLDAWTSGKRYKDYVKMYNSTLQQEISFNVFAYDEKNTNWVLIGPARLRGSNDRDTIDSPLRGRLGQFRWFAVQSLSELNFNYQIIVNSNDVNITVFE